MGRTHVGVVASSLTLCTAIILGPSAALLAAPIRPPAHAALRPAAVLTVISGDVFTRGAADTFSRATDGALLYVGSTVRTSADARALITLSDGSTVELEPASDITIEATSVGGGSTIAQSLGRGWHVVTHLTTADTRYEETTPTATASVRGIAFEVAVDDSLIGGPTLATSERRATTSVAPATSVVLATPDQATTASANSAALPKRLSVGALRVSASGSSDGRVVTQKSAFRVSSAERLRDLLRQREARDGRDRDERGD